MIIPIITFLAGFYAGFTACALFRVHKLKHNRSTGQRRRREAEKTLAERNPETPPGV
jgi:GH24 family phage-related lysozyme (muramidase)